MGECGRERAMKANHLIRNPFIIFSVILLLKSQLAWMVIFDSGLTWNALATELPFIWLVFCLIEGFATKRKLLMYLLFNLLFTGIFFAVIMYYKYYGVIATYTALQQVNQVTAVNKSVISLMDPQYLLVFTDIIVLGFVLWRRNAASAWKMATRLPGNRKVYVTLFALSVALCLFNIVPHRASMNEIKKAEEMGILNYEAYRLLSKENTELVDASEITRERIMALKGITKPSVSMFRGAASGKNIIMIQLESFQNFLIGLELDGQEVTPVMNKLAKENFYFSRFYQMVGQGNTSDAEFIANTSFYIPSSGAAAGAYSSKELPSLPRLMKQSGYDTATFHTNVVEFWNRGEMYQALGFDHYYDKTFFGTEDTVFFGASDEILYEKTSVELKRMAEAGKPFYAHVISMTAHHPFTTPEEKDKIILPERYEGTFVGDYIRAQSYADYALGLFIDELKQDGLWENSVIVLYGDHMGLPMYSLNQHDKDLMEEIFGHSYSYTEMINVPLIIASEGITGPVTFDRIGGQVDLLPTIANMVDVSLDNYVHFGQDLLNQRNNLLPQRYYLPSGSVSNNQALFVPGAAYADGTIYPIDRLSEQPVSLSEQQFDNALMLLRMSDSYVNQLPNRESAVDVK